MDEMIAVRRAVDRLLAGELGPLLDLLAEEVEFVLAREGDEPDSGKEHGKEAVADYFTALGGLVAFWQMDYTARGEQVIAWGKESFTVEHCGLRGGCEFAIVFDLSEGTIARLQMIEDLRAFMRGGGTLVEAPGDGGWPGWAGPARGRRLAVQAPM
jgi:ketosteroid isomerase-like protein